MSLKGSMSLPGWESTRGEKHRNARFTDEQIREIRNSTEQIEVIALKYGTSAAYVIDIKRRKRRKHVK
jgi:hypothetical protein